MKPDLRAAAWAALLTVAGFGTGASGLAAEMPAATCESIVTLLDRFSLVQEANGLLEEASRTGAADRTARAVELTSEMQRLIEQRPCYFDLTREIQHRVASGTGSQSLLPTLRAQRDKLRSFMDGLPEDFQAGRNVVDATIQSLNLGMALAKARERDDESRASPEALAELFLHVEVTVRTMFAHVEVAKARLETEILGRDVALQVGNILAELDDYALPALEFNRAIVDEPRLQRRPVFADGRLANQVRAYGEVALRGARFDAEWHCRLAQFKAWEALSSLAKRLGVVVRGEQRESCERKGDGVGVWLVVSEENVLRFRG